MEPSTIFFKHDEIEIQAERVFQECMRHAFNWIPERFHCAIKPKLIIDSGHSLKKVAGCTNGRGGVKLNRIFLETNTGEMLSEIIPHEVAHIITDWVYPNHKQAHGPEFRRVMREVFGLDGDTYHKFDTSVLKERGIVKPKTVKRYNYECRCGSNHWISTRMHNSIQQGDRRFCKRCKGWIQFTGNMKKVEK